MAEKDPETEKLELSLFRRKKKSGPEEPSAAPEPESRETSGDDTATLPVAPEAPEAPAPSEPTVEARPTPGRRKAARGAGATPAAPPEPSPTPATTQATAEPVASEDPDSDTGAPGTKKPRMDIPLPALAPPVAALVVGAVVGLAAVGLTFASLLGCELVTGTDSCGGPGLLVLLVVVVLMILGGAAALRQMDVPDAGGLSFLGVAMFVAVCLVVLLPSLLEPWMVVVAPVLCAGTFALAHWIVSRFDEDSIEAEGPEPHDVR